MGLKIKRSFIIDGILILLILMFFGVFMFYDIGIMTEDNAAVFLAALKLPEYKLFTLDPYTNIISRLLNYSHGFLTLIYIYAVYFIVNSLGIPIYHWVINLPATLCIWFAAIIAYLFTFTITKRRAPALFSVIVFISIPIIIGISRQANVQYALPLFLRSLLIYLLFLSILAERRRYKRAAFIVWGLLIGAENAFFIPSIMAVMFVFLSLYYQENMLTGPVSRVKNSTISTLKYFKDPFLLIPIAVFGWYFAAFLVLHNIFPIIFSKIYGFFGYTFFYHANTSQFGWHPVFFRDYMNNLGLGLGIALPIAMIGAIVLFFRQHDRTKRPIILFLILWIIMSILPILFYTPKTGAMGFIYMIAVPASILLSIILFSIRSAVFIYGTAIILIGFNLFVLCNYVFDFPYQGARIYGSPKFNRYPRIFKAIGAIIRSEGYLPLEQRRVLKEERTVLLTGHKPEWRRPFPALFYWGCEVAEKPNYYTKIIVDIVNWGAPDYRRAAFRYINQHNFKLKYIVKDGKEIVAKLYYRGPIKGRWPIIKQKDELNRQWDKQYAHLEFIKTPGRHAHAQ